MRAVCASSARTNGAIFAAAQSTDIVAFYILVAIVFNLDRRTKKYGDSRHGVFKQGIRWGGNVLLFLVMILGFAGALVGGVCTLQTLSRARAYRTDIVSVNRGTGFKEQIRYIHVL